MGLLVFCCKKYKPLIIERQINKLTNKNTIEINKVICDTYKLKIKIWRKHPNRKQLTIFLQKTYKNTINVCLRDFFKDLMIWNENLNIVERKALNNNIEIFLNNNLHNFKICEKILQWLSSTTNDNQNLYQYIYEQIKIHINHQNSLIKKQITSHNNFIPIHQFINRYRNNVSKKIIAPGVYIIWNKTKNLYYIGQSYNIFKRVAGGHFDLKCQCKNLLFYDDYKNHNKFFVTFIECERQNLNKIERETIQLYSKHLYNKTHGNI